MKTDYKSAEAFCLMKYASKDGQIVEWIWNSRDGVTPFGVIAKDGVTELHHCQWRFDVRIPNYVPQPGERVFVNLTLEKSREHRRAYVEEWWEKEIEGYGTMKDCGDYANKEDAVERLAKADFEQFGGEGPEVITGAEYAALNPDRCTAQALR